jgi:hypothetical protein
MSVPICVCRIKYDLADSVFPAKTEYCPLHAQATELFEIVDALVSLTEQTERHVRCRCLHCRAVRALRKARGIEKEKPCKEEEKKLRSLSALTK